MHGAQIKYMEACNMKILVIEDEKLLADSIKTLLEGKGFEVEVAYDGETGVFLMNIAD